MNTWPRAIAVLVTCAALLLPGALLAEQVPVRYHEGLVHGFLVLRTLEGKLIADGDLIQIAVGDLVTSHMVFRFKDGSLHDENATFLERGSFRLLRYHLVQKGPAFKVPLETLIDVSTGTVTTRYTEDGKQKAASKRLKLPPDVANGLIPTLLKNIRPETPQTTLSMVAATPKPRLVKLVISPHGEEPFSTGGVARKAVHFIVKVEIGGLAGWVAPLLGKQPPDIPVWILSGEAPAFVKSEGPLYLGGPIWRIELTSPVWPRVPANH